MSTENKVEVSYSFPFFGLLTLIFITLKLTGHIDWGWFWVISPMLAPIAIIATMLLFALLMMTGAIIIDHFRSKHRKKKLRVVRK